ncbi:MAG TPA: zinc ribbon domain-containing protein [Chloroflexota bacterium]
MGKKLIPEGAIPEQGGQTVSIDGRDYLVLNDAMFTFYRRSMGELSPFFLALRDEKKILGARCTSCGTVRVPPFATRCPECEFAETRLVEMKDTGTMIHTPPITYFATALFQQQVPFGRGRILLEGADTALSVNVYTTRGILVPGIIKKGTQMKVVFRDERIGEISDIFCVPASELTPEQVAARGLQESDLDWETADEPSTGTATPADERSFAEELRKLEELVASLNDSERARKDIADWQKIVQVRTRGGSLVMEISSGTLSVAEGKADHPDFVMVCDDLGTIVRCLAYQGSLTQSIMTRELWISKNSEFTTVFKLERMARSLARSKKG